MTKKILITGGNGFIAKNITEMLCNDYDIIAPNSKELNILDSDKVYNFIIRNKFDIIIHAATYDAAPTFSTKDPNMVLENNLKMFFNIARCKEYFGKMIYFGSGAEFGRENWIPKMNENYFNKFIPTNWPYGLSKYIMTSYTNELKDNIYNLRLFSVFGKYDDWRYRFISNACCKAVLNMPITLKQNSVLDYLYIKDLVKLTKWFIENKPKNNVYNLCSGNVFDCKTLAEKIKYISSKDLNIEIIDSLKKPEYSGDNTLLLNEVKDFKFTPINKSIESLYNYYNLNKQIIKKELFQY